MASTNVIPSDPAIKVIFKGLVITRIHHGEQTAYLGAVRTSPCHRPVIKIQEKPPEGGERPVRGDFEPDDCFSLFVEGAPESGIRVYQKDEEPFNRLDDENDQKDFRWFINLDQLHGKSLNFDTSKLFPVFTLNNALFYMSRVSEGEVKIIRGGGAHIERFGKFGLEIAANIYLDTPGSRAVFKKGDNELLNVVAGQGSTYEIVVDCNCNQNLDESDFPIIYDVVGEGLSDEEKVDFIGDEERTGPTRSPEVYCAGGNGGG